MSEEIYTPTQPLPAGALEPAPASDVPAAFQNFMGGEVKRPAATVTRHAAANATPRREVSAQGVARSVGGESDHGYDLRRMAVSDDFELAGYRMFARAAREEDLTQKQFEGVGRFYRGYLAAAQNAMDRATQEHNDQARAATTQALQDAWGPGYAVEIAGIEELFATMPMALRWALRHSETPTGEVALNNEAVLRWMAGIAHGRRGGGSLQNAGTPEDEIFAIEALMGDKSSAYWHGPRAKRLQARYLELMRGR